MSKRPLLVVVTGTGTDVGKTWAACALARRLQEDGLSVAARKPAQSFAPGTPEAETDASLLAAATGERAAEVCPPHRWYGRAMAPPMAAASIGLPVPTLTDLLSEINWPRATHLRLVELAGGVGSPLAADGDGADFVARCGAGLVVLVAGAGLGTLNDVRLCARALPAGIPQVVFLNRYDAAEELHRRNREWLSEHGGHRVVTSVDDLYRVVEGAYAQGDAPPGRPPSAD